MSVWIIQETSDAVKVKYSDRAKNFELLDEDGVRYSFFDTRAHAVHALLEIKRHAKEDLRRARQVVTEAKRKLDIILYSLGTV